jgi:hypothetical protein
MRVRKSVLMLAAAVTLLGTSAPAAYALDNGAPGGPGRPPVAAVQHHSPTSTDWLLIGVGSAGAITLAGGAGLGMTRRGRGTATTRGKRLGAAGGS